jgi:hypothetical protein
MAPETLPREAENRTDRSGANSTAAGAFPVSSNAQAGAFESLEADHAHPRQQEELELIRAMFADEIHVISVDPLSFTLQFHSPQFRVSVRAPETYPDGGVLDVVLETSVIDRNQLADIRKNLQALCEELGQHSEECIFDVISWIQEQIAAVPEVSQSIVEGPMPDSPNIPVNASYGRLLLRFHHIYSVTKRRNMHQWAEELNIDGIVLTGCPGLLVAEGLSSHLDEFQARVKSQRWKKVTVIAVEEPLTASDLRLSQLPGAQGQLQELAAPATFQSGLSSVGLSEQFRLLHGL